MMIFTDGVVAIAATLLIIPLVDIAANGAHSVPNVAELLRQNAQQLFVFALSFVVIARFWMAHHVVFGDVIALTVPLNWLNVLWLLSIVFLPFPTELLAADTHGDRGASSLYIGTLLVTSISALVMEWIIIRTPQVREEPEDGRLNIRAATISTALLAAAFVLAITVPAIGFYSLFLLGLTDVITWLLNRWRAPAATA
jgi:uncharacterized membrane protein